MGIIIVGNNSIQGASVCYEAECGQWSEIPITEKINTSIHPNISARFLNFYKRMFPSEVQSTNNSVDLSSIIPNSHPPITEYSQIWPQKKKSKMLDHN